MKIVVPSNVFVRNYGPYTYIFDQNGWREFLIKDFDPFVGVLSRSGVEIEAFELELSKLLFTSAAEIHSDLMNVIYPLVTERYLSCSGQIYVNSSLENEHVTMERGFVKDVKTTDLTWKESESAYGRMLEYFSSHPTPFELCIDLTRACTERCVHCYVPSFQNEFLPFKTAEGVLYEFATMGGLKVKLTGGECMLHPDFERILKVARAHDLVISVLSNLTCCDESKAKAMKEVGVAIVQVSLYGMTQETHEAVTRVKGSLEKTLRGIRLLHEVGVPVQIHCPVLKQNVSGIEAVERFGREMGMKTTFDAVMMSRADHGHTDDCGLSDIELKRFIQLHEDLSDVSVICPDVDANARVCEVGTAKICLSAEGKYYPCNGCYGYELGDCRCQTLAEVWNDEPIKQLRALRMRDLSACVVCGNRAFCAPCPARNFNANSDVTLPDLAMCRAAACRRELVVCANERS